MEDVMALLSLEDRRETQDCCISSSSPVPTAETGVERAGDNKASFSGLWGLEQTPAHFCLLGPPSLTLLGFCKSRV